jgi:hypothetical protein
LVVVVVVVGLAATVDVELEVELELLPHPAIATAAASVLSSALFMNQTPVLYSRLVPMHVVLRLDTCAAWKLSPPQQLLPIHTIWREEARSSDVAADPNAQRPHRVDGFGRR